MKHVNNLTDSELSEMNGNYDFREDTVHACKLFKCNDIICIECKIDHLTSEISKLHKDYEKTLNSKDS